MAFAGAWNSHKPNVTFTDITKKISPVGNFTSVMVENVKSVVRSGSNPASSLYYLYDLGKVTLQLLSISFLMRRV